MAHSPGGGRAFAQNIQANQFDIFEWHPKFQSCVRYFVDVSQHHGPVQNVTAFINILLPFQQARRAGVLGGPPSPSIPAQAGGAGRYAPRQVAPEAAAAAAASAAAHHLHVSLVPYVRRLVVTGFDNPPVLHGFFGDDWVAGVGVLLEQERRNYLFAMKSEGWLRVKESYDMPDGQYVPFLKPLQNVTEKEILAAEAHWSDALAMQDWMLGPRAPTSGGGGSGSGGAGPSRRIKREDDDN